MRVAVAAIPDRGRHVGFDLAVPWAVEAARTAVEAEPTTLQGELVLRRDGSRVRVTGSTRAGCERPCERCGLAVALEVGGTIDLTYVPEAPGAEEPERELASDELDVGWYREGELDLSDILSEAVALQLPTRLVCADVAVCDARTVEQINSRQAGMTGHPAFQVLRDLN